MNSYVQDMDDSSDKTATSKRDGPVEVIVAFGHRLKLHRMNSKDKLNNAFAKNNMEKDKRKCTSRLPRVKKAPLQSNSLSPSVHLEESGDTFVGSSKAKVSSIRSKKPNIRTEAEKLKGSHIPRPKIHSSPVPKDSGKEKANSNYYANQPRRVQRVHVPNITPDFAQDDHTPSTSVGSTRPIPTLGQIYKRNNIIIDGDRFYDWFMELDTPVNSLESNPMNTQHRPMGSYDSTDTAQSVTNSETTKSYFGTRAKPKVVFGANVFKNTNDNVRDWLTTELDNSSRDNESGYRSMSPTSRATTNIESKFSEDAIVNPGDENYNLTLEKTSEHADMEGEEAVENTTTDVPLVQQPTVVISKLNEETEMDPIHTVHSAQKIDISLEAIVINKSECNEIHQFPSINEDTNGEKQAVAPSYVECPSEVLQKTTNFEADGCASPNTLSSNAGTDLEIRDEYPSLYTLENVDDCNLEEHSVSTWCAGCRSQGCMTFFKSGETEDTTTTNTTGTTLQSSCCESYGNKSGETASVIDSDNRVHWDKRHYCHGCGKKTSRGDSQMYYKKHSRYRRFPSYRYKLTRPFDSLRKKLSLRRICRHHWNHVWKKTAARWKSRSHSKLRKYRMLQYLQRSIIWEDVDVQTIIMLYKEAGTHTIQTEQKSAGVSAYSMHLTNSAKKNEAGGVDTSARSFKSRFKQINLGPSRFPFFYNSKRKSMPLRTMEEAPTTVQRFNSDPTKPKSPFEINRNTDKVTPFKNTSITCELMPFTMDNRGLSVKIDCPCETDKTKTDFSKDFAKKLKKIHKLKTAHTDTETDDLKPWLSYKTKENNPFLTDLEMTYNNQCTQVMFSTKNIETAVSHPPIHHNLAIGKESKYIPFYKPCETNTNSVVEQFDFPEVLQVKTLTELVKPEEPMVIRVDGESAPLQMMSWQMANNFVPASTKYEPVHEKNASFKLLAAGPASTKSKSSHQKNVSLKISDPDCKNKSDLSTETPHPKLIKTDTNITSISSAQMLPVAVFTSTIDMTSNHSSHQVKVSSSCQCDSSLPCRCTQCNTQAFREPTGASYLLLHKSTSYRENDGKLTSHNSCNEKDLADQFKTSTFSETDTKQTGKLPTQFIKECDVMEDMGTQPSTVTVSNKTPYVFTDSKSTFAVSTRRNTLPLMVTNNIQDSILKQVSASTNTTQIKETRSIGLSAMSLIKPEEIPMIDSWVQYSHILEQNEKQSFRSVRLGQSKLTSASDISDTTLQDCGTEPILRVSLYKSMAVMTSGPLKDASNTVRYDNSRNCARVAHEMSTNTYSNWRLKSKQYTACSTQVFQSIGKQYLDKATCSIEDYNPCAVSDSRNIYKRPVVDQLTCLSRLAGQVKSGSRFASDTAQPITSTILSSNLNADKWIRRCTNDEKDYQCIIDTEQVTLQTAKQASISIADSSKSPKSSSKRSVNTKITTRALCDCNSVAISATRSTSTASVSTVTVTTESQADSLPTNYSAEKTPTNIKKTSDKVASDEVISKPCNECVLQACPDICETGTDSMTPNMDYLRSATAFTSRCVFPSPSACCKHKNGSIDCIFVYDRPRCAVHRTCVDATVQMSDQNQQNEMNQENEMNNENIDADVQLTKSEPTIDQLDVDIFPSHDVPSYERKTEKCDFEEVLPPKVYENLYENTQMVVNKSNKRQMPDGDTVEINPKEDGDAFMRALGIRSVAMLTSKCGMCASMKCCKCNTGLPKKDAMTMDRAEYVYAYNPQPSEGSTQTCSNCHARLLDIPPYYYADIVEDHQKTQFVGSCRYYSKLLGKRLGRVKEKVKHLAPSPEQYMYFTTLPKPSYAEACTMKPSGRQDLCCQTTKRQNFQRVHHLARPMSYCVLAPSLTNICAGTEKNHLNSVYYMLSAIDGRIRRLKQNVPS